MGQLKFFFFFAYVILWGNCFGQSGSLHVHFDITQDEKRDNPYYCYLYLNDSLIKTRGISSFDDWELDSLNKGLYKIELTNVGGRRILIYSDIVVNNDSTTYEDIMLGRSISRKQAGESSQPFEFNISCLYGSNNYLAERTPESHNQIAALRIGYSGKDAISKYDAICFYLGGSGSGTVFNKDSTTYKGMPVQRKWYSGFCFDVALYNRVTFFDCQKYNNKGLFIDVGVGYSLPLYYKEIRMLDRQTKIKTKCIHEYTDLYLLTRVGFKYIALTAEYNLSTFLKSAYTEAPTARIGLAFCISTDN
jgi:hypothetical protein